MPPRVLVVGGTLCGDWSELLTRQRAAGPIGTIVAAHCAAAQAPTTLLG